MKLQLSLSLGLLIGLNLAGCQKEPPPANSVAASPQWLDVPALPILQNMVFDLSNTLTPHKNLLIINQLCALARGEIQQESVNLFIQQQGINLQNIPKANHPLSLLASGNRAAQASACAAYLATTVLTPLNMTDLMIEHAAAPAQENGKRPVKSAPQINLEKLLGSLPNKLAIAQTNADFFALIATELQRHPGLTVEQYRQLSAKMFVRLAPNYLQRLKVHIPPSDTRYEVLKAEADQFIFSSSTRTVFTYNSSGLKLQQNGMTWLGEGKLLGKNYFLKTAYLPEEAQQLANTPRP